MWTVITVIGVIALVVFLVLRAMSDPRTEHDPQDQPPTERADETAHVESPDDLPERRPDGSAIPGSEAHRNEHGQK